MEHSIPEYAFATLREIVWQGSRRAAESLGAFSGNTLTAGTARANLVQIEDMFTLTDDPEGTVVGVDFSITGDIDGYLLAFFSRDDAARLLDALMGCSITTLEELGEMELSALGEAGNIIVSAFLVSLESLCGLQVVPSPPAVAVEMCGAILTSAVLPLVAEGGSVILIETDIVPTEVHDTDVAACRLLFLPAAPSLPVLYQAFSARSQRAGNEETNVVTA